MILFRPACHSLQQALDSKKEFQSLKDMMHYIVNEHNRKIPWFQIGVHDLEIEYYCEDDERCGWHDLFIICYKSYDDIKDKEGYLKYFGGEIYHHPIAPFGYFTTYYEEPKMANAEKFSQVFGLTATELWAKPEQEFLKWLNGDFVEADETQDEMYTDEDFYFAYGERE